MKLYEYPTWWKQLEHQADMAGEELPPELEAQIDALQADLADKVQALCCVIRTLQAEAAQAKVEAERLLSLAAVRERAVDRLKAYLLRTMQAMDCRQVKTPLFTVSVCQNSQFALTWTRPDELPPPEWCRTTVLPDFSLVRKSIELGGHCPDGFAVQRGHHLRIK